MASTELINKYDKFFRVLGFDDYMIDFSDISDENLIKLGEFVKSMNNGK